MFTRAPTGLGKQSIGNADKREKQMKVKRSLGIVFLFVAAVCLVGCVHVRSGLHNALADATDIVRADLSFSIGTDMGGHVMATKYAQLKSYSYEDLYRAGFGMRMIGFWKEDREDWWVGTKHARNMHASAESVAIKGDISILSKMRSSRNAPEGYIMETRDEFGVGAHLFLIGFRVGVRPLEFADFFSNFVGIDMCGDNISWAEIRRAHAATRAAKGASKERPFDVEPRPDAQ